MAAITYVKTLVEKLEDKDPITREDIESLNFYGAPFIDLLMQDDESTRHYKVAEAIYRPGIIEIKAE